MIEEIKMLVHSLNMSKENLIFFQLAQFANGEGNQTRVCKILKVLRSVYANNTLNLSSSKPEIGFRWTYFVNFEIEIWVGYMTNRNHPKVLRYFLTIDNFRTEETLYQSSYNKGFTIAQIKKTLTEFDYPLPALLEVYLEVHAETL